MAAKRTRRQRPGTADERGEAAAGTNVVKVTLRLSLDTARRLGVESVMSGESQSSIAERVLAPYLKRWRLPSTIDDKPHAPTGSEESAA